MAKREVMLCYPLDLAKLDKWERPWIVQPKLDGDRCIAMCRPGGPVVLVSSQMNMIVSVPHIYEALVKSRVGKVSLDGELYIHGLSHQKIRSIVGRKKNLHPDYEAVSLHLYDLVDFEQDQMQRSSKLIKLSAQELSPFKCIELVPSYLVNTVEQFEWAFKMIMDKGYEGIVVRHPHNRYVQRRSPFIMKLKPDAYDIYKIIGFEEERDIYGELKGSLGSFHCVSPDGQDFWVGSGFTKEDRETMWESRFSFVGKFVRIKYHNLSEDRKVPKSAVYVEVLTEKEITE